MEISPQYDYVILLVHSKEAKIDLSPWTQNYEIATNLKFPMEETYFLPF